MNFGRNILNPVGGCLRIVSGTIAAIIFIGVGVGMYIFMGDTVREAYESKSWPTVQGQVISSELRESRNSDNERMYSADVLYTYNVNGEQYENTMITMMDGTTSMRNSVQKTVSKYRTGTTVTVYYKPDDPAYAILEPGFSLGVIILGSFMVCFPLVGIAAFFGSLFGRGRSSIRFG
ncbi:MAG: DUF3592 domain-containing protein [Anaerolineae bacterium]|nr:DUF3592 domain-containing protein [Anaerolineae bacterium]